MVKRVSNVLLCLLAKKSVSLGDLKNKMEAVARFLEGPLDVIASATWLMFQFWSLHIWNLILNLIQFNRVYTLSIVPIGPYRNRFVVISFQPRKVCVFAIVSCPSIWRQIPSLRPRLVLKWIKINQLIESINSNAVFIWFVTFFSNHSMSRNACLMISPMRPWSVSSEWLLNCWPSTDSNDEIWRRLKKEIDWMRQ